MTDGNGTNAVHAMELPTNFLAAQLEREMKESIWVSWLVFVGSMVALIVFSAILLDPAEGADMSAMAAIRRSLFWCLSGILFAVFVWGRLGSDEAFSWMLGYCLEYALSFDNLFLFHIVFTSYGTPRGQVYRGIITAMRLGICVRFALFFVSEEAFNLTFLFRWTFGAILLYSGVKVMLIDEDEGNPTDNCLVRLVTRHLPVHHEYVDGSAFFVHSEAAPSSAASDDVKVLGRRHEVMRNGGNEVPAVADSEDADPKEFSASSIYAEIVSDEPSTLPFRHMGAKASCLLRCFGGYRVTPLFLAVITLMIVDAVFAVDSVTAKVSMVSQYDDRIDFFLNFTSTAFAMLCMPSLYFIIVLMVDIFRFLKYGLGGILILIGLKLLLSDYIKVREDVSGLVLLGILGLSMLASLLVSSEKLGANTDEAVHDPAEEDGPSLLKSEA